MYEWVIRKIQRYLCYSLLMTLLTMSLLLLGYFSYRDHLIVRERQFEQAVKLMTVCNDTTVTTETGLITYCEEKKDLLRKPPQLYALKDVICSVLPCKLIMSQNSADSILEKLLDFTSERSLKILVVFVVGYVSLASLGLINIHNRFSSNNVLPMVMYKRDGDAWSGNPPMEYRPPSRKRFSTELE